ncbi:hypothetical protein E2C01_029664 [Portunus trituberculatus]|uniref:Uncharacterized protein n=1 Tax=Portunus trituberculatus TaxID=210409 RepID=A0A5B7ES29_PORTR|nr:hypothetical protein [Portunus trituberculatus]
MAAHPPAGRVQVPPWSSAHPLVQFRYVRKITNGHQPAWPGCDVIKWAGLAQVRLPAAACLPAVFS